MIWVYLLCLLSSIVPWPFFVFTNNVDLETSDDKIDTQWISKGSKSGINMVQSYTNQVDTW